MFEVSRSEHLLGRAQKFDRAAQDLREEAERHDRAGGSLEATRLRCKANRLDGKADLYRSRALFLLDAFQARF